jgi:hypothetical protein
MHDERLLLFITGFIGDRDAALFSERWIVTRNSNSTLFDGKATIGD